MSGIGITLYSSLGGIKSVIFTDVIQFFTFGIVIPAIAYFLFNKIENTQIIINTLSNNPLFDWNAIFSFSNPEIYYIFSLFLWILIPEFNPAIFQRIAMAKNVRQVRLTFLIGAVIFLLLTLFVCWIGVLLLSLYPNMNDEGIIKLFVEDYKWVIGFKGLILSGIMAMIMSTVDSYINSSSILLVHDIQESLNIKLVQSKLLATRIYSALIGLISILLAMHSGKFLELILWASMCYVPIVTVPFMMSVFGFRSGGRAVLSGMVAGFSTVVVWELFFKSKMGNVAGLVPGILANLIFLVGYHYLFKQPGGWVGIKDPRPLIALRQNRNEKIRNFQKGIIKFDLCKALRKNTPKNEAIVALFGLFVMLSTFFSTSTLPEYTRIQYETLLNIIYPTTLCFASLMIGYPLWAIRWNRTSFLPICWNIMMFFVIICFSFLTVLISNFSEVQLMVFMVNILVISSIMNWRYSLFYLISGLGITLFVYDRYLSIYQIQNYIPSLEFKVVYLLLLVSSTLIMFLKPKQEYEELTEERVNYQACKIADQKEELNKALELKYEFLRNLQHESHTPITGITSMGEALYYSYDKLTEAQRKGYLKDIAQGSTRLNSYVNNLVDLSKLSSMNYEFNMEEVDLGDLVHERLEICKKLYIDDLSSDNQIFTLDIDDNVIISCDKHYISQVIDNIIINAIQYCAEGEIIIKLLQKEDGQVEFSVRDEGIGIPKGDLLSIFGAFTVSSYTKTPSGGRGVGLALCKKIIELHNGRIWAESDGNSWSVFKFTLTR